MEADVDEKDLGFLPESKLDFALVDSASQCLRPSSSAESTKSVFQPSFLS